jgi:hypothetical protein
MTYRLIKSRSDCNLNSAFSLLAAENGKYSKIHFMLSTIGNYSLFPLLFRYQGKLIIHIKYYHY